MNFFNNIRRFFSPKIDPLDQLLIDKGKDPDKIMEDLYFNRLVEGDSNPTNRALNRYEQKREIGNRIAKNARSWGQFPNV